MRESIFADDNHALKRAGIENFRFHDLRHTWASWHVQSGTPPFALQELAGWETERMLRRYAYLAANHLAAYVANAQSMAHSWHRVSRSAASQLALERYEISGKTESPLVDPLLTFASVASRKSD